MVTKVHKAISGHDAVSAAISTVQAFAGLPVHQYVDRQLLGGEIIKLQKYLSTVSASTPSGFKFDPAKVNRSIDDQLLGAKMIDVQNAANNT